MWNLFTHFFKCRHLIWLPVLCVTLAGCKDDFDDSELRKQIADLDGRLTSLEKLCAQMNTNISSMQTIVNALQQNDYITGVTPITEGSNTIGYTITFAKNKPITIYHGENGSTPVIGIKKDTDGIYYWTLDGEWLLDASDNKIKAEGTDGESGEAGEEGKPGQNGITPVLKIEEGYWYVSYDNENSWQQLGKASGEKGEPGEKGDSMFSSVDTSNDGYVIFTLADGTELKLPRKDSFGISFSNAFPGISAGETIEIEYTLPKGDEKTLVKTACQNGWQAVVNKKDHLSGTITITAPDPITDDEVLVFVSDGEEKTVMSAISFCIVILDDIQDNTVKVGGGDGYLNLEITSNLEIKAVPKNEWIITDEQPQSKALATNHFHFKVLANGDKQNRTGHIEVQDMGGKVLKTITVVQGNALEEEIAKEREILIKFYYATNGDQWENNTNWCSDKPVGEWYGVETHYDGLVYKMRFVYNDPANFNGNNLSGHLIPELGDLSELSFLEIQFSQLSGNIPEELGKLKHLYHLNLSYNQLSGEIPTSISQMTRLQYLELHKNQLSGEIPNSIWQMPSLKRIELQYNQLSGELPQNINDLKTLDYLDLSYNQFTGEIPETICLLSDLFRLELSNNQLTGTLPENIGNLKKLEILKLANNQLSGTIPASIKQCSELTNIDLSNNQLHGDIMLDFFLQHCDAIHLNNNYFTGSIPAELASWLDKNFVFNISYNCLSGTIPWEVVYHFRWGSSQSSIQPQNEGYRLEIPTLYESTDYSEDGKVIVLQKATAGNGINVAIVGDGFADVDFTSGHFDNVMHKTMEGLFRLEPMKSFRHLFNVYAVKTVSKHNVFLEGSETALEGKYGKGEIAGTSKAECNEETLRNKYINKIPDFNPDEDICFVILNAYTPNASASYCRYPQGFSYSISGLGSYTPASNNLHGFENDICKRFGDTFGRLGAEWWFETSEDVATDATKEKVLKHQANGWYMNLSVAPENVPWKKFLTDERYANEDVGIYEGGYYCASGIYRSSYTSIMRTTIGEVTFNVPSREAIYKRMMQQAYGDSWQYDYEKFVEYDAINRNSTPQLLRSTADAPKEDRPRYYPMVIIHEQ